MSIIYDALKKVEKSNNPDFKVETEKSNKHYSPKTKTYLAYALVVCVGLFIGNIIFGFLTKTNSFLNKEKKQSTQSLVKNRPSVTKKPIVSRYKGLAQKTLPAAPKVTPHTPPSTSADIKKGPEAPWVLNGVFFSENEGYALINNQIAKEGDVIDGATVKRISLNEVELEANGSAVKLSNRF